MGERWPVLTVRQPWCWSILHAGKRVENRPRRMAYCGPLLLHAGARSRWDPAGAASPLVREAWGRYVRAFPDWPGLPASDVELGRHTTLMPFGAVAGMAEVTGCHHAADCGETPDGLQLMCSPWAVRDQWHIELEHVGPLPEPVPCRGGPGLWELLPEVDAAVREQLSEVAR